MSDDRKTAVALTDDELDHVQGGGICGGPLTKDGETNAATDESQDEKGLSWTTGGV